MSLESSAPHHRGHPDAVELARHGVQLRGTGILQVEGVTARQENQAAVARGAQANRGEDGAARRKGVKKCGDFICMEAPGVG